MRCSGQLGREESPTNAARDPDDGDVWHTPPPVVFRLRLFDPTPFASLGLKHLCIILVEGKKEVQRKKKKKNVFAYSKKAYTRRLCLPTAEHLSQAGGESKALYAFTAENV